MVIFRSYVSLPEGRWVYKPTYHPVKQGNGKFPELEVSSWKFSFINGTIFIAMFDDRKVLFGKGGIIITGCDFHWFSVTSQDCDNQ